MADEAGMFEFRGFSRLRIYTFVGIRSTAFEISVVFGRTCTQRQTGIAIYNIDVITVYYKMTNQHDNSY